MFLSRKVFIIFICLMFYHMIPDFKYLGKDALWKQCRKRRKCWSPAFSFSHIMRTRGRWFNPRLGQYSIWGLMIVIATGLIPLSLLSVVSTMAIGKAVSGLERILCWLKELQESMDRCTACHDTTEILLKMALTTIQPINQSIFPTLFSSLSDTNTCNAI